MKKLPFTKLYETYFTKPYRPTQDEIDKYKNWLQQIFFKGDNKKIKALVLGATPELRDLLTELNIPSYCIDISPDMINFMSQLIKRKNPDEVIIKGNWLNNPLADKYFDIVLGDCVISNVMWDQRMQLLSQIKRILKPGGHFLCRTLVMPEKNSYKTLEELLEIFAYKKPYFKTVYELFIELQMFSYDRKTHTGSFEKAKSVLEKLRKTNRFLVKNNNVKEILNIYWDFWVKTLPPRNWSWATKMQEEKQYKKYFTIKETFQAADDAYNEYYRMYLLKNI